jgi:hypothetical protein
MIKIQHVGVHCHITVCEAVAVDVLEADGVVIWWTVQ